MREDRFIPVGRGRGFQGAIANDGGLVLVLTRMNRILEINDEDMLAVVEPGVVTDHLHRAVEAKGLFYPPDPASLKACTISGNVAENAGGPGVQIRGHRRLYLRLGIC